MSDPVTHHRHYAGAAGMPPAPGAPADRGERPVNPGYAEVFDPARRVWAVAVAENIVWAATAPHALHVVDDCWIDTDLALCLCYTNTGGRFGVRWASTEVSPLFG